MKAKKIYYSIVVGLQSLFILLLFVNIGYCIITSDLTMFPTTALYLNFYPFMNFFKTHNPYDLIVFISLLSKKMQSKLSEKSELKYRLGLFCRIYPPVCHPLHWVKNNHLQDLINMNPLTVI